MSTQPPVRSQPPPFIRNIMNPLFGLILRSPLHGLLSKGLTILEFEGRKSGRRYSLPVAYGQSGAELLITTAAGWKHNFNQERPVTLLLRGRRQTGRADLIADEVGTRAAYRDLLATSPRLAEIIGVRLDQAGDPHPEDVAAARARGYVILRVRFDD